MVVAIDGPAGAGKSTIARLVAKQLGFVFVNSGTIYRAITVLAIESNCINDEKRLIAMVSPLEFDLAGDQIAVDGRVLQKELRTDAVETAVARISSIGALRIKANTVLLALSSRHDMVVEGRDMTTAVFPTTPFKFFLDASSKSRAARRLDQGTSNLTLEELEKVLVHRDEIDKTKEIGGLSQSDDAVYLDTTDLTIEEVCAKVVRSIQGHSSFRR